MQAGTPQGTRSKALDHQYPKSESLTERSQNLDDQISQSEFNADVSPPSDEFVQRLGPQRVDRYDKEQMDIAVKQREQQVSYVEGLFVSMLEGKAANVDKLGDVCRDSLKSIVADKDMFLCLGLNPFDAEYPSWHSLHFRLASHSDWTMQAWPIWERGV